MPMTTDESSKWQSLGTAGNTLQEKIADYVAKKAAADAASAALTASQTALDQAVTTFRNSDQTFTSAFTLPSGYTPPA